MVCTSFCVCYLFMWFALGFVWLFIVFRNYYSVWVCVWLVLPLWFVVVAVLGFGDEIAVCYVLCRLGFGFLCCFTICFVLNGLVRLLFVFRFAMGWLVLVFSSVLIWALSSFGLNCRLFSYLDCV